MSTQPTNPNKPTQLSESFATLFEESGMLFSRNGDILTAEVVGIDKNFVTVNAGLKSEGIIEVSEFANEAGTEIEVSVGDFVRVVLESMENGFGQTVFSRIRAKRIEAWEALEKALEDGTPVNGQVIGKVKGGLSIALGSLRGFLPGSQADTKQSADFGDLLGKFLDFRVIKMDKTRSNVVVSRRALLLAGADEAKSELWESLKEGTVVTGTVKSVVDYGAFVDLGGIDGLVHISDMAWRRPEKASDVVTHNQIVQAIVLRVDKERGRVSLGLKQLAGDPWEGAQRRFHVGSRYFGKVSRICEYGAFVELDDGIEGLTHMSEMDWARKNPDPAKLVVVGQEVEVVVLECDEERRRLSLGMKQCISNPWEEFLKDHPVGSIVDGEVKSVTDFGVFIALPGGLDGLARPQDLGWSESERDVSKWEKGALVKVAVLSIDPVAGKVGLGVKTVGMDDPFVMFVATHQKGDKVSGTVTEVDAKSAKLDLGNGVFGVLRAADFGNEPVADLASRLTVGSALEAAYVGADKKARTVTLSTRALEDVVKTQGSGLSSLGALLKEKMQKGQ